MTLSPALEYVFPMKMLPLNPGFPSLGVLLCFFPVEARTWSWFLTMVPLQCLTEDKLSALLHLVEDELDFQIDDRKTTSKLGSDIQVHATACVLSLCGWACRLVSVTQGYEPDTVTVTIYKPPVSYEKTENLEWGRDRRVDKNQ